MNFSEVGDKHGHVKCPFPKCNTKIIPYTEKLSSTILRVEDAPEMTNLETKSNIFFKIDDMWDFDNIGVSRPMEEIKDFKINGELFEIERYLICSECDRGPIGFAGHFTNEENKSPNNLTYFLSCNSMKYEASI